MSKNFCCELSYTSNKDTDDSTFSIRPASALIFVLAVEIMAIKLRETKHIRGIEIKLNSITGNLKIHLMNELLKPNLSRHSVINDHSKESNAFVKSRNNMAPSMLNFSE
jgi:hypothetical protein